MDGKVYRVNFSDGRLSYDLLSRFMGIIPSEDMLLRVGAPFIGSKRDWNDCYELIYPRNPDPLLVYGREGNPIDENTVRELMLAYGYYGNFPMYELPPIAVTGIGAEKLIDIDKYSLRRTWNAVNCLVTGIEKPACSDKALYCASYFLLALHNEFWLHACKLLEITWTPQAGFLHKCFYSEADTPNREWDSNVNILMCYKWDFFYSVVVILWCSWLRTCWGNDLNTIVPFDLLNWKEDEFNDLACIQQLHSSEFEGADKVVLEELTLYCNTLHTFYQRLAQTELIMCKDDTIYGKVQWLFKVTLKLISVLPYK